MVGMNSERYARQELIDGWDQEKISDVKVSLVGSERLSDLILTDILSIGFRNIRRIGVSDFIDFEKLNPDACIEQIRERPISIDHAGFLIDDSDFVIDATNDYISKRFFFEASKKKDAGYISAFASTSGFLLIDGRDTVGMKDFENGGCSFRQGDISSIVCSALATDELRRRVMPLKDDYVFKKFRYGGINENTFLEKKVVQIGAGAIGTFSAMALALMGVETTIIDFDVVEESNLNRQFLFYDSVGLNKANVLVDRLRKYSDKLNSVDMKIESDFNPEGYDAIFSCVDNNEARYYLNKASLKYGVPLINAGSSILAGTAMCYCPGKTACLDCQTNFKLSESIKENEREQRIGGCFQQDQPSLIVANQVVGGLMVNCWIKSLKGNFEKSTYSSGFGIYDQLINSDCLDTCRTRIF
jgi:molybdopterin/thiamine biosynthesis adenylyltransferase